MMRRQAPGASITDSNGERRPAPPKFVTGGGRRERCFTRHGLVAVCRHDAAGPRHTERHLGYRGDRRLDILYRGREVRARRPQYLGLGHAPDRIAQLFAGLSLFAGGGFGRWVGIIAASATAIVSLLSIPAYPFWSLCVFALAIIALAIIVVYELAKPRLAV